MTKKLLDKLSILMIATSFVLVTAIVVDNQLTAKMKSMNIAGDMVPAEPTQPRPTGNSPGLPPYPDPNLSTLDKLKLLLAS